MSTLSQKYQIHMGTSPGLWCCAAHLLCSQRDETLHTQDGVRIFGGLRRQGHISCYSLAARAAQVQEVQAATGAPQQMERTVATGRALLLLSTTERD